MQRSDIEIVLLMMVKNEEAIIGRAIKSAVNFVDWIMVVDTGSTDRTREEAYKAAPDKSIHYFKHQWQDFGSNRTAALYEAKRLLPDNQDLKKTYFLLLDADDEIAQFPDRSTIPEDAEVLTATNVFGSLRYPQIRMVRADVGLEWVGKTHEVLICTEDRDAKSAALPGFTYIIGSDSSRRKSGCKSSEDIELLREELKENPNNTRALFYLGNCLWDSKQYAEALDAFRDNVHAHERNPGFDEELYLSIVRAGDCCLHLYEHDAAIVLWLEAIEKRPHRPEAYACLAKFYHSIGHKVLSFKFASDGAIANPGKDRLFVDYGLRQLCRDLRDRIADEAIDQKQAS